MVGMIVKYSNICLKETRVNLSVDDSKYIFVVYEPLLVSEDWVLARCIQSQSVVFRLRYCVSPASGGVCGTSFQDIWQSHQMLSCITTIGKANWKVPQPGWYLTAL